MVDPLLVSMSCRLVILHLCYQPTLGAELVIMQIPRTPHEVFRSGRSEAGPRKLPFKQTAKVILMEKRDLAPDLVKCQK